MIEQRGIRQWTEIGFSSIYYLLAKLEKRDLVHVPDAPTAAKSRRCPGNAAGTSPPPAAGA